jgi:predicted SnoaL-like aldol condensation-catalyzing enzyme
MKKQRARKAAAKAFLRLCATGKVREGNLVAVHSRVRHQRGGRDIAVVHIFRFRGERVVELWDIAMEAPAESPNQHGLF